jgi:RNA polymerase sigma-70 factor (ECF subfamily)
MADSQEPTRASLLEKIRDLEDTAAWQRYLDRYRPLLANWCRRYPLQDADVDEVVGMVLLKVVQRVKTGFVYDPSRTYRGWLRTVLESQVKEFWEKKNRQATQASGDTDVQRALEHYPTPDQFEELEGDLEALVKTATAAVQRKLGKDSIKWRSFELTALAARKGKETAELLGIPVGSVHQNKSRVARMIRDELARLREEGSNAP